MANGLILFVDEPARGQDLQDRIAEVGHYSDALSMPDWGLRKRGIALVAFDREHLHYAALIRRGRKVATSKYHVRLTDFVNLEALPLRTLERQLSPALRQHYARVTSSAGAAMPPATWAEVLSSVKAARPSLAEDIEWLEARANETGHEISGPATRQLAEEKDSLVLARRIFGFRANDIEDRLLWTARGTNELPSFLAGLYQASVPEDVMINHDSSVFGLWELVWRSHVGAAQFVLGDHRLTILTANRRRLERTLGVDLIYWHDSYSSFTMVQYKRMTREPRSRRWEYRPGGSYAVELQRMETIDQATCGRPAPFLSHRDFRLSRCPFYFKLCHVEQFSAEDDDMVPGMYIPLDYWRLLLQTGGAVGPRGGAVFRYDNVGRHLNNTEFVSLVQSGWIGSHGASTEHLETLVQQALEGGRAVQLAVAESTLSAGEESSHPLLQRTPSGRPPAWPR